MICLGLATRLITVIQLTFPTALDQSQRMWMTTCKESNSTLLENTTTLGCLKEQRGESEIVRRLGFSLMISNLSWVTTEEQTAKRGLFNSVGSSTTMTASSQTIKAISCSNQVRVMTSQLPSSSSTCTVTTTVQKEKSSQVPSQVMSI